jgi:hypothetical protein
MAKKDEATETTEPKQEKIETIKVKSNLKPTRDGGNPVALWEVDERHPAVDDQSPGGEIFVAGNAVVEVAKTPAVLKALSQEKLVEVK